MDIINTKHETRLHRAEHNISELQTKGYNKWMMRIPSQLKTRMNTAESIGTIRSISVGLLYVVGLSEHQAKLLKSRGINAQFTKFTVKNTFSQLHLQGSNHADAVSGFEISPTQQG